MIRIEAITIDLWNTLVDGSNGDLRMRYRVGSIIRALEGTGETRSEAEIESAIRELYPIFEHVWKSEQRTLTTTELVALIWKELVVSPPPALHEEVTREFEESILHGRPQLLKDVPEALRELSDRYRLSVVSDTAFSPGRVMKQLLEELGIAGFFSAFVFSDETGVSKPHPRAFRTALASLEISPANAVHVGDIEWTDVRGAKDLGMRAILFRGDHSARSGETPSGSSADAVAESWNEVLRIIRGWSRDSAGKGSVT